MEQQKDIDEAVAVIQKSIEKKIAENTEIIIVKDFLETLFHKIEQIDQAKVVSQSSSKNFINISCEIPKISPSDPKIANRLIETIDKVNLEFFFKKQTNLHVFNFCSKYFMFSQFCSTRQINSISFNWSKNKFDENKICFCFMCKFHLDLAEEQQ